MKFLAERRRLRRQLSLEIALYPVLLERRRVELVGDVAEHLDQTDFEAILALAGALAYDQQAGLLFDHRRRRHPVQRPVAAGVVMHEEGAVGLEHQQANSLRKPGGQATGVVNLAAGDEQAHRRADRTVPFGRSAHPFRTGPEADYRAYGGRGTSCNLSYRSEPGCAPRSLRTPIGRRQRSAKRAVWRRAAPRSVRNPSALSGL